MRQGGVGNRAPHSRRTAPVYHERLRVPVRWWALGTLLVGSFWLAMVVAVPETLAWTITALLFILLAVLLRSFGSPRIVVTDEWLYAGRARIRLTFLGPTAALDASQMRSLAGRDANARAYLLIRPYISTGVRITIDDYTDPTPYWLLSSRRATELATALNIPHSPIS
jgi:hypothetical protein